MLRTFCGLAADCRPRTDPPVTGSLDLSSDAAITTAWVVVARGYQEQSRHRALSDSQAARAGRAGQLQGGRDPRLRQRTSPALHPRTAASEVRGRSPRATAAWSGLGPRRARCTTEAGVTAEDASKAIAAPTRRASNRPCCSRGPRSPSPRAAGRLGPSTRRSANALLLARAKGRTRPRWTLRPR